LVEEFYDLGSLVKGAGVVSVSSQSDATDSGGSVVESDGTVPVLKDGLKFVAKGARACNVPTVVNMHV
jgi:hypothetical protein